MVEGETGFPDAEKHGTVATGQEIGWGNWTESMALQVGLRLVGHTCVGAMPFFLEFSL